MKSEGGQLVAEQGEQPVPGEQETSLSVHNDDQVVLSTRRDVDVLTVEVGMGSLASMRRLVAEQKALTPYNRAAYTEFSKHLNSAAAQGVAAVTTAVTTAVADLKTATSNLQANPRNKAAKDNYLRQIRAGFKQYCIVLIKKGHDENSNQVLGQPISFQDLAPPSRFTNTGTAIYRHLLARESALAQEWDEMVLFHDTNFYPGAVQKDIVFASGETADVALAKFEPSRYTQCCEMTRADWDTTIFTQLQDESANASFAKNKAAGPVIAWFIVFSGVGAPALYLMSNLVLGVSVNFGGEVAGAVILGLLAVAFLVGVISACKTHHMYAQVGNFENFKGHFGPTLFAAYQKGAKKGLTAVVTTDADVDADGSADASADEQVGLLTDNRAIDNNGMDL